MEKCIGLLLRYAIAIAVLLTHLETEDEYVSDERIARGIALAFMTHRTTGTTEYENAVAEITEGDEGTIDDDDEDVVLDGAFLGLQIADLEEAFRVRHPSNDVETHVVDYVRRRLLDTNAESNSYSSMVVHA